MKKEESKTANPVVKQWEEMKEKYPDTLILFRFGDFYETYGEDAKTCASILGITLRRRNWEDVAVAGFPYHALDSYLPKLIRAGKRVAICDPLEESKPTKKLVKQESVEPIQEQSK